MTTPSAPPSCPVCGACGLASRDMPLDVYSADGTPRYRILRASWTFCGHCGAAWFPPVVETQASAPIPQPEAAPTPDFDC